jgi:hypothetical protein
MFATSAVEHPHRRFSVDDVFGADEAVFAAVRADDLIRHQILIGGKVAGTSASTAPVVA